MTEPTFFASQDKFRKWLEKNHDKEQELLVGFWKVGSCKPSMTWSESVDQALCYGWIDGVRRRIDDESYSIRFSPRRPRSIWSKINIEKVQELKRQGLMAPAGLAAYEHKDDSRVERYAYENRPREFEGEYLKVFKKNKKAWTFFSEQPPSYRRVAIFWVTSAKQEPTRQLRLQKLIVASTEGKRV